MARLSQFAGVLLCFSLSLVTGAIAQTSAGKVVGTVKSLNGNSVVLTTDAGADLTVTIADSARIVRAVSRQTDLKTATQISASDIHVGDRIFARGQSAENGAVVASSIIVMSKGDIAQRQQQERDEWRRGIGGIVKSVDASGGTVTLTSSPLSTSKPVVIRISTDTTFRRYPPDSAKFDDAKSSRFDEIKPGDQIQARGTKNPDGAEFAAREIISGSFKDITGTVVSTNTADGSITVMDLTTKKPVTVKVSEDSQLRKLLPMVAMGFAMKLKGGSGAAAGTSSPEGAKNSSATGGNWSGGRGQGGGHGAGNAVGASGAAGGPGGSWRAGGSPDLQQILSHMPAVALNELNKGDAVVLVATEGSATSPPTVTNLLAGVEPILTAAPGTRASTILSSWSLGTAAGVGGDPSSQ